MFSQPLTAVAAALCLLSVCVQALYSDTCSDVKVVNQDDIPYLSATCRSNAPTPDWPDAYKNSTLNLSESGHILYNGQDFWPQFQQDDSGALKIHDDGHTLEWFEQNEFGIPRGTVASWDLDQAIHNDDGTLTWGG